MVVVMESWDGVMDIDGNVDMQDVSGVRVKRTFAERSKKRYKFLKVTKKVGDMGLITDVVELVYEEATKNAGTA
jgi:hypothetical protein